MKIDKKNLAKYQRMYKYAYILSDGVFKIVFAEEKDHTLLISLLNAMLNLHGKAAIKSITLEMQDFPEKIQKFFVEIGKFLKLEKDGKTRNDHTDAAQWLRAIKAIIKEEPAPERILKNETFKRLLNSVKLINFAEETFNLEVRNMTDVTAELENIFYKGERSGIKKERTNSEKKLNLFVKRIAKKLKVSEEELLALKP